MQEESFRNLPFFIIRLSSFWALSEYMLEALTMVHGFENNQQQLSFRNHERHTREEDVDGFKLPLLTNITNSPNFSSPEVAKMLFELLCVPMCLLPTPHPTFQPIIICIHQSWKDCSPMASPIVSYRNIFNENTAFILRQT